MPYFLVDKKTKNIEKRFYDFPKNIRVGEHCISNLKNDDPRLKELGIFSAGEERIDPEIEYLDYSFDGNNVVCLVRQMDVETMLTRGKHMYSELTIRIHELENISNFTPAMGEREWEEMKTFLTNARKNWTKNRNSTFKKLLKYYNQVMEVESKSFF